MHLFLGFGPISWPYYPTKHAGNRYDTNEGVERSETPSQQIGVKVIPRSLQHVYRRFVPRYATVAAPLTNLLKKGTPDELPPFEMS